MKNVCGGWYCAPTLHKPPLSHLHLKYIDVYIFSLSLIAFNFSGLAASPVFSLFRTSGRNLVFQIRLILLSESCFEISNLVKWLASQIQEEWNPVGVNRAG